MSAFVFAGVVVAVGLVLIGVGLVPPRRDLAANLGRWEVARRHATRAQSAQVVADGWQTRLGRWLVDEFAKRGLELPTGWRRDLAIGDRTVEATLATLAVYAVGGVLGAGLLGTLTAMAGLAVGPVIPAALGLFIAVILVAGHLRSITAQANERRAELRRSLGTYLDLVSMCLAGGQGITQALPAAATIGTGWTFEVINDTVRGARASGLTPWEALGELGVEYGISELTDLSSAAGLVGDSGAKVRASLNARATTLRKRQLADARAKADAGSDDMRLTQVIVAFGFLAALMYPAAAAVLAA